MGFFSKIFKKPADKISETMDKANEAIKDTKETIEHLSTSASDLIENGNKKIEHIATFMIIASGVSLVASAVSIVYGVKAISALRELKKMEEIAYIARQIIEKK